MRPRRALAVAVALAVAGALLASRGPVRAAPEGEGTWSVDASDEVARRIEAADRLLGNGRAAQAAPLLQEILDRFPDHLVRVPDAGGRDPLRFEGARAFVVRRIRELSPESRRAYDAFAGQAAEEALAADLRTRNASALDADAQRFALAGPAGPRLLLAAADLRLARGEPGLAVPSLRTLLREHAGTPAAGPAAAARLARALGRSGDRDGLLALARELQARPPAGAAAGGGPGAGLGARLAAGDGETTLGAVLDEALAAAGPQRRPSDTTTLGGGPERRSAGAPAEPLEAPRWVSENPRFRWTRKDEEQRSRESSVSESLNAAKPMAAALVDGVLYYHWSFDIVAQDLYTGRERWRFRVREVPRFETARTHGSLLACPAVADGVVYAPLQVWPAGEPIRSFIFANQDIIPLIPVRRLFAVDAATGRLIWTHDDPRPPGDPFAGSLRLLNLTSPPLVRGDLVVAAGTTHATGGGFTAWALAADRRTGAVRWITRLGYGAQEQNLFGRTVKEVPVAAVASDGERLFVQTNMGFVSCLDASTGHVLWTRGYRETAIPLYESFWTTPERPFTWTGSPPVVAGGRVLVAPADGADLLALEADTGRVAWTFPSRGEPSYDGPHAFRLLGADEERAFVTGRPSVWALDLRGGKLLWETQFPGASRDQEESAGRGVVSGGRLFVPTNRALYCLDIANRGAILRTDPIPATRERDQEGWGGNLVTTEGAAALVSLDRIEAHFRAEDVRARAAALLRDHPRGVDSLVEAAHIYLAADRPEDAIPLLERALDALETLPPAERDRRRREVRQGILEALEQRALALAEAGKPEEARAAYSAAAARAPDPGSAAGALLRGARALGVLAPPRLDLAAALVEEVVAGRGEAILEEESQLLEGDRGRCTAASYALWSLAKWYTADEKGEEAMAAAQRILDRPATDLILGDPALRQARILMVGILQSGGPALSLPYERRAAAALEAARRTRDPAALAAVAERWPHAPSAVRASIEEARLRLDRNDGPGVVASMRRLQEEDLDEEAAAEAQWLLGEGLLRAGRPASARTSFQKLARDYPEVVIPFGEARVRAADAVARRLESADMKAPSPPPPGLPAGDGWRELWSRELAPGDAGRLLDPPGEPLPGGRILLLRGVTLQAFDAATGKPSWTVSHDAFRGRAASAGGVLVFALEKEAYGFDPVTGDLLWRSTLPGSAVEATVADALVVLLLSDPDDPGTSSIVTALDPSTGDPAWPQEVHLPDGAARLYPRSGGIVCECSSTGFPALRVIETARGILRPLVVPLRFGGEPPSQPVLARTGPLLLRRDEFMEAFDPRSGARIWNWSADGRARLVSAVAGEGAAVVIDAAGILHALDANTGRGLWAAPAGPGRQYDPSGTALLADGQAVYFVTVEGRSGGGARLEARGLADGGPLWTAPLPKAPALVEVYPAGATLIVKYLAAGGGGGPGPAGPSRGTGVLVVDRATGKVLDRLEDDRLGGDGFDALAQSGVLAVGNEQAIIVRGR